MKKYAKHSNDRITSGVRYAMPAILIGLFMAAILAVLVLNTFGLHNQLQRNAEGYADDISAQLASNISSRMQMRSDYIRNLADTFSKMPVFLLSEELLDRKAEYLEMEEIFVVQADGIIFPATAEHTELMPHLKEGAELSRRPASFSPVQVPTTTPRCFSPLPFPEPTAPPTCWWGCVQTTCFSRCFRKWTLKTRA